MSARLRGSLPMTWEQRHLALAIAQAALNPNKLDSWFHTFARAAEGYTTTVGAGSGAQTHLEFDGGYVQITTGATANSDMILRLGSDVITRLDTRRWCVASRARISSTPDAQSQDEPVILRSSSTVYVSLVVTGSTLNLRINNAGAITDVAANWTVDTVNAHDFAITFDLTTVRGFVDGVQVAATANLTNLAPTSLGQWAARVRNGTTAAAQVIRCAAGFAAWEHPDAI